MQFDSSDIFNLIRLLSFVSIIVCWYFFRRDFFGPGFQLLETNKFEEAMEAFFTQIKKNPKRGNLYFGLGFCYLMKGYFSHALDNFYKARDVGYNKFNLYAALTMTHLEIDPQTPGLRSNIEKAKNLNQKSALESRTSEADAQQMIAWIHLKRGEKQDVLAILSNHCNQWKKDLDRKKQRKSTLDAPSFYRMAMLLKLNQQQEEALEYFNLTITSAPKSIFAQYAQSEIEKMETEKR